MKVPDDVEPINLDTLLSLDATAYGYAKAVFEKIYSFGIKTELVSDINEAIKDDKKAFDDYITGLTSATFITAHADAIKAEFKTQVDTQIAAVGK